MKNEFDNVPVHTSESLTADKKDRGNKMTAVRDLIVARKAHIEQLLPKHMDPGRLARLAMRVQWPSHSYRQTWALGMTPA